MLGKYDQIQLIFRLVNYSGYVVVTSLTSPEQADSDSPCISVKSTLVNHHSDSRRIFQPDFMIRVSRIVVPKMTPKSDKVYNIYNFKEQLWTITFFVSSISYGSRLSDGKPTISLGLLNCIVSMT